MADEYSEAPYFHDVGVPKGFDWKSIINKTGADLDNQYIILRNYLNKKVLLAKSLLNHKTKFKICKLSRLLVMVDDISWVSLDADIKGDIYEGILEKNAEDTKTGAGQYFTPRSLIKTIIKCMKPLPMQTISDPACGTGGFS